MHTVSSADPLEDLPSSAADALAAYLLVPVEGDLGSAIERCEAVAALLDGWQHAFFAALPTAIDRDEEARYAAEAGIDLDDLEPETDEGDEDWAEDDWPADADAEVEGQLGLDTIDLDDLDGGALLGHRADPLTALLDDELVSRLERELLLLPLRVRLEALLAASSLVEAWSDLLADHEKLLGHVVLAHGELATERAHDHLADLHAALHDGRPGHP